MIEPKRMLRPTVIADNLNPIARVGAEQELQHVDPPTYERRPHATIFNVDRHLLNSMLSRLVCPLTKAAEQLL